MVAGKWGFSGGGERTEEVPEIGRGGGESLPQR